MPVIRHDAKKEERERKTRMRQASRRELQNGTEGEDRVEGRRTKVGRKDDEKFKEAERRKKERKKPYMREEEEEILQIPKIKPPEMGNKEDLGRKKEVRRKMTVEEDQEKLRQKLHRKDRTRKKDVQKLRKTLSREEVEKEDPAGQTGRGTVEGRSPKSPNLQARSESVEDKPPRNYICCLDLCPVLLQGLPELFKRFCNGPKRRCLLCHKSAEIFKRCRVSPEGRCRVCHRLAELLKRTSSSKVRCSLCPLLQRDCACPKDRCPTLCRCLAKLLRCIWTCLKRGCLCLCSCLFELLKCISVALKDVLCHAFTTATTT